jgi:hypothetical protein
MWREVFVGARGRLTTGLLILEALVAVEILVVATILPAVQRDLRGRQLYGWNYAALTLASFGASRTRERPRRAGDAGTRR